MRACRRDTLSLFLGVPRHFQACSEMLKHFEIYYYWHYYSWIIVAPRQCILAVLPKGNPVIIVRHWYYQFCDYRLIICAPAVHPRGPAEWACYQHYNLDYYYYYLSLSFLILSINKLYPEAVHPGGPAEGIHYRYFLAPQSIFKHVQGC